MAKKIASKYYSTDWPIDLADRHSENWPLAIEIIKDRFESRFLNPVNSIVHHTDKNIRLNSGFLIMSIDCLLIETLNQFYLGLKKTNDKYFHTNPDGNYKRNWQAFRDFFNHSIHFSDFKDNDILSEIFFDEIRCGLLHQAESKTNSLINLKNTQIVIPVQFGDYSQGIIINRNLFHSALKKEFDKYFSDLNNPDSVNILGDFLRDKCNEKMTALCQ